MKISKLRADFCQHLIKMTSVRCFDGSNGSEILFQSSNTLVLSSQGLEQIP